MITIFEQPYKICFTKNPIRYGLVTDADISQPGFAMQVRIMWRMLGSDDTFTEQLFIPLTPNESKTAFVNISRLIDSLTAFYTPDLNKKTIQRCSSQCVEFYIDYREVSEEEQDPEWTDGSGNVCTAMKGGISYEKWQGPNYFVSFLNINRAFLTWFPKESYVSPDQVNYLYYLHMGGLDTINLRVKITYTDASTNVANYLSVVSPLKYAVYNIPTGVGQLGLEQVDNTKQIYFYEVEVINAGGTLAGPYRYMIDYREITTAKFGQLTYRNSLGGLDSIRILGEVESALKYTYDPVESAVSGGYYNLNNLQPQFMQILPVEVRTYKASVGYLIPQVQDALREANIKRDVMHPRNGRWFPVVIVSNDWQKAKNTDMLVSGTLEFQMAWTNENYTPDGVEIGDLPACPVPTDLAVTGIVDRVVSLAWTGDPFNVGFVIQASGTKITPEGGQGPVQKFVDWHVIGSSSAAMFQYDVSVEWQTIKFRVKAHCAMSDSGWSNEITANL